MSGVSLRDKDGKSVVPADRPPRVGYRYVVEKQLRQIGCLDWFDTLVTAEDTELHKPEPDVFLEAARRLDVPPAECCVYEDSDLGIEAARRAGMTWVDVRQVHTPKRITVSSTSKPH